MIEVSVYDEINQPELYDYINSFPEMPCNTEQRQTLFNIITDPVNIQRALLIAEEIGCPPMFLYEKRIQSAIGDGALASLSMGEKQFVDAVVRVVMGFNGWEMIPPRGKEKNYSIFSAGS